MNDRAQFSDDRSVALKALLMETARSDTGHRAGRTNKPLRRQAAFLITVGIAFGVAGTGGAVWALNGLKTTPPPATDVAPTFPAYYDQFVPIGAAVAAIEMEFGDVYAGLWLDDKTITLNVGYYEAADPERVAQYLAKIEAIHSDPPLSVAASAVSYDYKARSDLVADIGRNGEKWSAYFGEKITGAYVDDKTGVIHVGVGTARTPTRTTAPDGTPILFGELILVEYQ